MKKNAIVIGHIKHRLQKLIRGGAFNDGSSASDVYDELFNVFNDGESKIQVDNVDDYQIVNITKKIEDKFDKTKQDHMFCNA